MKEQSDRLNNQAIILASDGAYSEAIACFKRAITLERDNYLLWYNLGITYRDAGNLEEAKNSLCTAFAISPENPDVEETYGNKVEIDLIPTATDAEVTVTLTKVNDRWLNDTTHNFS